MKKKILEYLREKGYPFPAGFSIDKIIAKDSGTGLLVSTPACPLEIRAIVDSMLKRGQADDRERLN